MRSNFLRLFVLILVLLFCGCHGMAISAKQLAGGYVFCPTENPSLPPCPQTPMPSEQVWELAKRATAAEKAVQNGSMDGGTAYREVLRLRDRAESALNLACARADAQKETGNEKMLSDYSDALLMIELSAARLALELDATGVRPLAERERVYQTETVQMQLEPFLSLSKRERSLLQAYETLPTETVVYVGETEWTWERLMEDETLPFAEWDALFLEYRESLVRGYADLLRELVETRNAMAAALGYANARELVYRRGWREYSAEEADLYCRYALEKLGDWYRETAQAVSGDLTAFWLSDAYPLEKTLVQTERLLEMVMPTLLPSFRGMTEEGCGDLGADAQKSAAYYTTYLWEVGRPYTFLAWDDSAAMPITLLHELGHYHSLLHSPAASLAPHASRELSELDAYGLEQLAYPHLELLYGRRADEARIALTLDAVYGLLYACRSELFLKRVYTEPWEEAELKNWYMELSAWDANAAEDDWATQTRLYYEPFSELPIALAITASLELGQLCDTQPKKARRAYERLLVRSKTASFLETLACMGLRDPFSQRSVEALTEELEEKAEAWTTA